MDGMLNVSGPNKNERKQEKKLLVATIIKEALNGKLIMNELLLLSYKCLFWLSTG